MSYILHNLNFFEASDFQLPIENRGFLFSDGFFETMIYSDGAIKFFDDHFIRFQYGLEAYNGTLSIDLNKENIHNGLIELVSKNGYKNGCKIKLIAFRTEGGTYVPDHTTFEILAMCRDHIVTSPIKYSAIIFDQLKVQYSRISGFKNLSADVYVQAGIYMKNHRCDEVIILGAHGVVAECLYSNIYWVKDQTIFTPSLESGCVAGISRKNILKKLTDSGFEIKQGSYKVDELLSADSIFNSNVGGVSSILKIGEHEFSPISDELREIIN